MKITHITTTPFRLPLFAPLRWGRNHIMPDVHHVLVRVALSDGSEGVAEALPRPTIYGETVSSVQSIIAEQIAPRLIGQAVTDYFPHLGAIKNNHTAKGAVDIALQAAVAQSKGVSLVEHMGGTQTRVRVSYILGLGELDTVLADARRVYEQGVRVLKVKVGRDWEADLRQIRALQDEFGAEMALYADANECFTAVDAAQRLDELHEMGLLYCEEPLPVEQVPERTAVRAGEHLPIIADDSCFTQRDLHRELALNTFDILNIKTARTGYTESMAMLAMAHQAGKGLMLGSQAASALGASRTAVLAAHPAVAHPSELSFFLKLKEDIVTTRPRIAHGYLAVDSLTAVAIDEDLLREAASKG
jgi:L-alanine-DL-glutamate epimerase-like enolase superfamily enzyme